MRLPRGFAFWEPQWQQRWLKECEIERKRRNASARRRRRLARGAAVVPKTEPAGFDSRTGGNLTGGDA